jgi:hypothetical protein
MSKDFVLERYINLASLINFSKGDTDNQKRLKIYKKIQRKLLSSKYNAGMTYESYRVNNSRTNSI